MQTSRFQLGLIATLAVGLGLSLASSDAVGYPAGAAVSMGSNPVVSTGGQLVGSDSAAPLTAPGDSSLVITSVVLSAFDINPGCMGNSSVVISDGTDDLARFVVGLGRPGHSSFSNYEPVLVANMPSGIHIPAGATLTVTSTQNQQSSCYENTLQIEYTVSGYYAQA
jgi:hypothetical protein